MENPVYSAMQQMLKVTVGNTPLRRLEEIYLHELYSELRGELYNIVLKGAYDSIKILNQLTKKQEQDLLKGLAVGDRNIFVQYNVQ